jgi:hypothetical protein
MVAPCLKQSPPTAPGALAAPPDAACARAPARAAPSGEGEAHLLARIAAEVRTHPARDALGALAFDVLSRLAEGKELVAGREHVEKRAAEYGVDRARAQTSAGNLLGVLERGAETDTERAMVAAFAVHGLGQCLASSPGEEAALVARFVRHTDGLEFATPDVVCPLVDALLPPAQAARFHRELAQAIVDDASGPMGATAAARARNAARLSALAASPSEAAARALAAVADTTAIDAATRALASALRGPASSTVRIRGRVARARRRGAAAVFAWASGWALLTWVARGIGSLLGFRREAELSLGDRGVEIREERFVLGRKVGESVVTVALTSIVAAGREVRYPSLHLLVGAVALSIGVLVGGLFVLDGVRSGERGLLIAGALLVLVGAALDLALEVLVPGGRGRVSVDLAVHRGRMLRVVGVPLEEADRFLTALARHPGP